MIKRKTIEDYVLGNILFDPTLYPAIKKYLKEELYQNKILLKHLKEILSSVNTEEFVKNNHIEQVLINRLTMTDELEDIGGIAELVGLQAFTLSTTMGKTAKEAAQILYFNPYTQEFNEKILNSLFDESTNE